MPTTVRFVILSTDPEAGIENNMDVILPAQSSRHEHWTIAGNVPAIRFFWPVEGEMYLFLQLWRPQPATEEAPFFVSTPGDAGWIGWDIMVPPVGRTYLLLRKPRVSDIIEMYADRFTVEVEGIYF